jgi:putative acetyltransferase
MSTPTDFDIRFSSLEDLSTLQKWFNDPAERDAFPFETDQETEESLKNWIGFSKYQSSLTGMLGSEICAVGTLFLMPYRKVAHHCSFYLIVKREVRRQGIGASMIRNLLHLAKTRFRLESVHAEIYEPSPLIPLLVKQGFHLYARQDDFIQINGKSCARSLVEHFFA